MEFKEIQELAAAGESETVELKKSTAQLPRAGKSLCALLNSGGGRVLIGVKNDGDPVGQLVSEKTLGEIGRTLSRIEPPAPVTVERVSVPYSDHEVVVLEAANRPDLVPFAYDGRPYVRLGTNTERMEQLRYQELLLARNHTRTRWESQPAEGISLDDLDVDEILRTVRRGIIAGRLPESTGDSIPSILERFRLFAGDWPLNAAIALFGRFDTSRSLAADYPQCLLQLARFKGRRRTSFWINDKSTAIVWPFSTRPCSF